MQGLTKLQQNRRIVLDFTLTTLSGIPTQFGRLVYVASLRDLSSGRYEHSGLAALYPDEALQQALQFCHEQLFERILETSLKQQLGDLRSCLESMQGGLSVAVPYWHEMESFRVLLPENSPGYLRDLFCSNARALLEILTQELTQKKPAD